jgi:hypothetical protein
MTIKLVWIWRFLPTPPGRLLGLNMPNFGDGSGDEYELIVDIQTLTSDRLKNGDQLMFTAN